MRKLLKKKVFKLLLLKAYFDRGLSLTNYMKYIIAIFGFYSLSENIDFKYLLIIGVFYIIFCFILGWLWYKYRLIDLENEINNIYNPFQREIRRKLRVNRHTEKFK